MDYSTPLRVAISTPGNDGPTVEPISPPSDSRNPPVSNIGASHLRTGLPRPTPELLSTDHLTGHGHSQSHIMSRANASNSHIMDPLSVGIPHGSRRVVPRPVAGDPTNETTPLPGSLASPVRNKAMSPAPSPISNPSGSKSTNFHNIADLIGGSKSHRNQFPLEGKSPELSQCIKQQTTPTSNPRLGDSSDDYIDVVDERRTNSPDSCFSEPSATRGNHRSTPPDEKAKDASPTNTENNRARKGRTIYKAQQVYVLEEIFRRTHYPDPEVIETLSRDLDISENKIKVWFQNKRARWRRRAAETGHPVLPPLGYNPMGPSTGLPSWHHTPPGGLHVHTTNSGALLVPQPIYSGLQGSPHIPLSQPPTPLSMIPQLQSLYSMGQGLMSLKAGLHNFPQIHHGINLPMMHVWPDSSKLAAHSS